MTITQIKLKNFTAFEDLNFIPNSGINIFIGANGMGKTHLMKIAYAAMDISKTQINFAEKLIGVFLPSRRAIGRLIRRNRVSTKGSVEIWRGELKLRASFSNHSKKISSITIIGQNEWFNHPIESVFIPVKEMLANAPGFRSLYTRREIHFEEIYADIIDRASLPTLRGPKDKRQKKLLNSLQKYMNGKIIEKNQEFFLKNKQGELEFTLLAEGIRKLGLLWILIQNGVLTNGSVLFWDEPEANLNPNLLSLIVDILLQLQRIGVQIFLSTHNYALLKEFELTLKEDDKVSFHSLYRKKANEGVVLETASMPFLLNNSPIAEAMSSLYDREIQKSLGNRKCNCFS